ncbi:hypothetical protein O181_133380 [Austropuccinia psidii MF-1]|uniref:Uncharacterized protein n=1 Tax=Austropuccinia psidii MF-1 TaxID=1389203 RepID=A0A9Q3L838_9BASI|nr:hypothetical protein [Austropuccinia psidii MF-1]
MFEDNPTEENQATVERLAEETCPSSPTQIVIKKKKDKKLDFPGPTIQDYEGERGSQCSIQSDVAGLRGTIEPSKGKRKGKIPSGTESTQRSALSQRQASKMPIISEPELELRMGNSNRYKSHSEGSDRHVHEPVQAVPHSVQGQGLGDVATITPRIDELLAHPQNVLQRGGNSEILQWMEPTIIQTSNQKDQDVPCQKEGGSQGRSPSSFYQQAPSQPTSPRREEEQEKVLEITIFPKLQDSKIQKDAMDNVFNLARTLMEFKDKEEQRMRQPRFPKK